MTVQLVLTDRIRDAIENVLQLESTPKTYRDELAKWRRKDESGKLEDLATDYTFTIPFKTVKQVHELLKKAGTTVYLNELLEGSELYCPPIQEPKKSPELIARLERLRAKQDQVRYRAMVKNIDKELVHKNKKEMAFEVRSTSRQLSSVVNFVLSVAGTFAFGFLSSQYAFADFGLRVMFGIILASIVALAELYFMARTEI